MRCCRVTRRRRDINRFSRRLSHTDFARDPGINVCSRVKTASCKYQTASFMAQLWSRIHTLTYCYCTIHLACTPSHWGPSVTEWHDHLIKQRVCNDVGISLLLYHDSTRHLPASDVGLLPSTEELLTSGDCAVTWSRLSCSPLGTDVHNRTGHTLVRHPNNQILG